MKINQINIYKHSSDTQMTICTQQENIFVTKKTPQVYNTIPMPSIEMVFVSQTKWQLYLTSEQNMWKYIILIDAILSQMII